MASLQLVLDKLCPLCIRRNSEIDSRPETRTVEELKGSFIPGEGDHGTKDFLLHYATHEGHDNCVHSLITDGGCDVNQKAKVSLRTPLMVAALTGFHNIIEKFIDAGADINVLDILGKNALMYASSGNYPKCVEILLKAGAILDIHDKYTRQSALMMATWSGYISCMKLLSEHGAKFDLFGSPECSVWDLFGMMMVQLSSSVLVEVLMIIEKQEGALSVGLIEGVVHKECHNLLSSILNKNFRIKGNRGEENPSFTSVWIRAIENGYLPNISLLLKYKSTWPFNLNNDLRDIDGKTMLQIACEQNVDGVVKILLQNGVNANGLGKSRRSPLFIALRSLGYNKFGLHYMASLIKYGCDVDNKCFVNLRGVGRDVEVTALEYALHGRNLMAATMLVDGGAQNYNPLYSLNRPHKAVIHKRLECTEKQVSDFVEANLQGPTSLFTCCKLVIRRTIGPQIDEVVSQLPIPDHIKDSICYGPIERMAERFMQAMKELRIRYDEDDMTEASIESRSGDEDSDADFDDESDSDDDDNYESDDSDDVDFVESDNSNDEDFHPAFMGYQDDVGLHGFIW